MEDLLTRTKAKAKLPRLYSVVLLNDDFTPADFVARLLVEMFAKTTEEAISLAMEVHRKGRGIAGTYTRDIAETKVSRAVDAARAAGHPLLLDMQEG